MGQGLSRKTAPKKSGPAAACGKNPAIGWDVLPPTHVT